MKTLVFVGTSGWYYRDWNPDLSLDWYMENTGLNAIELNASFMLAHTCHALKALAGKTHALTQKTFFSTGFSLVGSVDFECCSDYRVGNYLTPHS